MSAFLIFPGQATIAGHIGIENGCQFAIEIRLFHVVSYAPWLFFKHSAAKPVQSDLYIPLQ